MEAKVILKKEKGEGNSEKSTYFNSNLIAVIVRGLQSPFSLKTVLDYVWKYILYSSELLHFYRNNGIKF